MKEKLLMTSFMAAGIADVATTAFALHIPQLGASEVLPFMGSAQLEAGTMSHAYIYRMAFTALYIGAYALTRGKDTKLSYAMGKVMPFANYFTWGIVLLNTAQIIGALR